MVENDDGCDESEGYWMDNGVTNNSEFRVIVIMAAVMTLLFWQWTKIEHNDDNGNKEYDDGSDADNDHSKL